MDGQRQSSTSDPDLFLGSAAPPTRSATRIPLNTNRCLCQPARPAKAAAGPPACISLTWTPPGSWGCSSGRHSSHRPAPSTQLITTPCPAGRSGSTSVYLSHMDPTGLVGMQLWKAPDLDAPGGGAASAAAGSGTLLLCVSPSKRYFRGIATHIDNAVHGVMQVGGWLSDQGEGRRGEGAGLTLWIQFFLNFPVFNTEKRPGVVLQPGHPSHFQPLPHLSPCRPLPL